MSGKLNDLTHKLGRARAAYEARGGDEAAYVRFLEARGAWQEEMLRQREADLRRAVLAGQVLAKRLRLRKAAVQRVWRMVSGARFTVRPRRAASRAPATFPLFDFESGAAESAQAQEG